MLTATMVRNIIESRLRELDITKTEFARRLGKSRQDLTKWLNRRDFYVGEIYTINKLLDFNLFIYMLDEQMYKEGMATAEPVVAYHKLENPLDQLNDCRESLRQKQKEIDNLQEKVKLLNRTNQLLEEKAQRLSSEK